MGSMLTMSNLLMWIALGSSLVLVAQFRPVIFPVVALIASLFEVLMAFHVVQISVAHVPLMLIFSIALLVAGVLVYWKASAKATVTAAAFVALVGALQTVSGLHLH
jgi:hypothetical protein